MEGLCHVDVGPVSAYLARHSPIHSAVGAAAMDDPVAIFAQRRTLDDRLEGWREDSNRPSVELALLRQLRRQACTRPKEDCTSSIPGWRPICAYPGVRRPFGSRHRRRSTVEFQGLWSELDAVTLMRFLAREEGEAKAHSDCDQEEGCVLH